MTVEAPSCVGPDRFTSSAANFGIVGRSDELALIDVLLGDSELRALVLEGEPGIGKTRLWLEGVERAQASGYEVLRARPTAIEASLSLGGLRDLVGGIPRRLRQRLPGVQERALAVALAEEQAGAFPVDSGVLGVALLGLLRALAAERPVLVAIDDLQWLDEESGAVVVYALRRAGEARIRCLVSARGVPGGSLPFALEQGLDPRSLARVMLGPLSEGAIRRLLRLRLGLSVSRAESHAVYAASRGIPFFALELGRTGIEVDESGSLRVPPDVQELVWVRLRGLPAPTRDALLVVAALADPSLRVLARAGVSEGLETALDLGVLELEGEEVRFAHPLAAAAVWAGADEERRGDVHRLLAGVVEDREQRARHLAAVAEPPDEEVAGLLEEAAKSAHRRGAPSAAAELLDRARELAPVGDIDRWARLSAGAADAHAQAGHWDTVQEYVAESQQRLPPGPERAAILIAAGEMRPGQDALFRQAIAEAGETAAGVRARIGLSEQVGLAGGWGEAVEATRDAAVLARRIGDRALLGVALTWLGGMKLLDSQPDGVREVEEARAIEQELGGLPTSVFLTPQMWLGAAALFGDDPARAQVCFAERLATATERGDDMSAFQSTQLLIFSELRAGDWAAASRRSHDALERVEALGYDYGRPVLLGARATIEAYRGELEGARALGSEAVSTLTAFGDKLWSTFALASLVLTELCAGDADAALAHVDEISSRFPGRECWWSYHQGDEIEALVLAGEHEGALARVDSLRQAGNELGVARFLAWAERGRGLVLAAQGDLAASSAALEQALAQHERFSAPLERTRTLLACGRVLRLENRRREARAALSEALAEFERLGARHFAHAARVELGHLGGRAPAGAHELTGAEERVASLVAGGLSNKEVAAELVVEVSTVEATLTRVYRKLGVRSRSQLARVFTDHSAHG